MAEQTPWQRVRETSDRVSVLALGAAAAVAVLGSLWAGLAYRVSMDRLDRGAFRDTGVVLNGVWRRR